MVVLYINVFFTYYYTYQLFFYSFQTNKLSPYLNFHKPILLHSFLLFIMSLFTLFFGFFYISVINPFILFVSVSFFIKLLPLITNIFVFIILFLNNKLFTFSNQKPTYYFSNIMFLSNIMITFSSNTFLKYNFNMVKTLELGFINYNINSYLSSLFSFIQIFLINLSIIQPLKLLLISVLIVMFITILL